MSSIAACPKSIATKLAYLYLLCLCASSPISPVYLSSSAAPEPATRLPLAALKLDWSYREKWALQLSKQSSLLLLLLEVVMRLLLLRLVLLTVFGLLLLLWLSQPLGSKESHLAQGDACVEESLAHTLVVPLTLWANWILWKSPPCCPWDWNDYLC